MFGVMQLRCCKDGQKDEKLLTPKMQVYKRVFYCLGGAELFVIFFNSSSTSTKLFNILTLANKLHRGLGVLKLIL